MSTENLLKELILKEYNSVRDFCMRNDFPYSTIDNIFRRGLMKSSVSIVIRVCDCLSIDIDELVSGKIVYRGELNKSKGEPGSAPEKITSLFLRLDMEDRGKAEGFIEGLLAADKYEGKKERRA